MKCLPKNLMLRLQNKWKHYRFLSNQDDLISFWWRRQFPLSLFFSVALTISTINIKYAFFPTLSLSIFLLQIVAIVGMKKGSEIYRLLKDCQPIIYQHKSEELKKIFRLGPKYLIISIFLDTLFPITFPFSFLFKIAFVRNADNMKRLMMDKQ